MTPSSKPPERYFSAICTNGVFRIRMRATFGPQNASFNRTGNRASAHFHQSAVLSSRVSGWRATIEHTQPIALVARAISQGLRLINRFLRAITAPGSLQFPLVNGSAKPTNGLIYRLFFSPNNLSWLAAHDEQLATKEIPNVGKAYRRIGNV